ncbi:MAG: cytochrome c5 family protein [Armatimonadetes bacterium]|nr:cytochrome c5 family protein [Armatimonadota bacterium]
MKIQSPILLAALAAVLLGVSVAMAASTIASHGPVSGANHPMVTLPAEQSPKRLSKGEQIYQLTCHACHETGAQGAPRLGNREEWKERLGKGRKTLLKHSLEGFGLMPAKGGHTTLTKKQVTLALDFMLAKLR